MNEVIEHTINTLIDAMPENLKMDPKIRFALESVAKTAYTEGHNRTLSTIMTADQVAEHFGITLRRAQALIRNRHERFGYGAKIGRSWCITIDELDQIAPDNRYRT